MPNFIEVTVKVEPIAPDSMLHPYDQKLSEFYIEAIPEDTPANLRAAAALDSFHEGVAIKCVDDFEITTHYDGVEIFEEEEVLAPVETKQYETIGQILNQFQVVVQRREFDQEALETAIGYFISEKIKQDEKGRKALAAEKEPDLESPYVILDGGALEKGDPEITYHHNYEGMRANITNRAYNNELDGDVQVFQLIKPLKITLQAPVVFGEE